MVTNNTCGKTHHSGHCCAIARYKQRLKQQAVAPILQVYTKREIQMFRILRRYYSEMGKSLSEAYLEDPQNGVENVIGQARDPLNDLLLEENSDTAAATGSWQIVNFRKSSPRRFHTKQFDDAIKTILADFLASEALNSTFLILDTDRKNAAKIIANGIEEGLGERDIAKQLDLEFSGNLGKFSAARIARTEVGIAGSKGQDTGAREIGAVDKVWNAVEDSRTRESHSNQDGNRVSMDQFFYPNGQAMLYPHDTRNGATPDNFINCRCVVLYE